MSAESSSFTSISVKSLMDKGSVPANFVDKGKKLINSESRYEIPCVPLDQSAFVCDTSYTMSRDGASSNSVEPPSSTTKSDYSSPQFVGVEHKGNLSSNVYYTQGGTPYWTPVVPEHLKPVLNKEYDSWDDVVNMYSAYADASGFCIRLGTIKRKKGSITHRYITCNKNSKPKFQDFDSTDANALKKRRRRRFKVTNCKARIKLSTVDGTSKFNHYGFVESHNHTLVDVNNMEFTKQRRKLGYLDHQFIHKLSLNKIGASVSHRLQCSLRGGSENVRGTKVDYKNAARDMRVFIGERDGQMIVDTLTARRSNLPNFFFEYVVVGSELRSLFWVDDVSLCNYASFGDVLGFDATYQTNK